jgi:protein ImuB
VRTVGELLALGQDAVMDRLGLEAIALFAAASAQTMRPLHLVRPVERYEESFEFEQEIETAEPLLFILNRFVDQISQRLELSSLAAERLTLRLQLASGGSLEFFLQVPQPTRRADVLFRMLQTHLEAIRTDSPITGVALQADPSRPSQKQFSLFEAALRDPHQFQETLARLSALVGAARVGTPVRENSHRPDAFKLIPPDFENAPTILRRRVAEILRPTPLRRLRPGIAASVEQPDSAVVLAASAPPPDPASPRFPSAELAIVSVRCPSMPGVHGRVTVARGPWRASGHWWESGSNENNFPGTGTDAGSQTGPAWQREEWDVQIQDGPALRLVQRQDRWEVEALLD